VRQAVPAAGAEPPGPLEFPPAIPAPWVSAPRWRECAFRVPLALRPAGREGRHRLQWPSMSDFLTAYICECGKKWSFSRSQLFGETSTIKCKCGRTIILDSGFVYAIDKTDGSRSR
jgi:hypothetical protein